MNRAPILALLATTCTLLSGCAYDFMAPGAAADMSIFRAEQDAKTDDGIRRVLAKEPLAIMPAAIAVARVQASGYQNYHVHSYGRGRYSVVTTRDVETDKDYDRLRKLPMVKGVSPIGRLLLPQDLQTDMELRGAAAALGADLLLIYTFDTEFKTDDWAPPLSVVTLGLFPTNTVKVYSTASALMIDVRNGYIYGSAESTATKSRIATSWTSSETADSARRDAERDALDNLLGNLEKSWGNVVLTCTTPRPGAVTYTPPPRVEPEPIIIWQQPGDWRGNNPPPGKTYSTWP